MTSPQLVRNDNADAWGLYYPERNVIEAALASDLREIPGKYMDNHWNRAEQQDLRESIEADIEDVREDIRELRGRDLTEEQERQVERLELKLDPHETVLEIAREVDDE